MINEFINPTQVENSVLQLIKRDGGNNPFTYGEKQIYDDNGNLINEVHNPYIEFRGRPAGKVDSRNYRIQKGVEGARNNVLIVCSNLPDIIDIEDKVLYLGQMWNVKNIGYFLDESLIIDAGIMSNDYILSQCPKGITLG